MTRHSHGRHHRVPTFPAISKITALASITAFLVLSCAFPLSQAQEALPPWRLFNAFFRDLPQLHPDFEAPYAADYHQTGLVATTLNAEGRPAFILPARRNATGLTSQWIDYNNSSRPVKTYSGNVAIANQGHFFFDEYYTDIPGVNIGYNITLNFTLDDPNLATYRWEKPFFFPLDNKGFGMREGFLVTDPDLPANFRDGIPHNFWFTTQMEMTFFYRGGEVFRFNGDDDLWVFIDGKLTSCDLGGIHASRECQVNLDTLNLRVNSSYSMSVFHAERHTDASYFAVTTSVKPVNRPPVAANVTASVRAEKSIDLTLQGFDPDNDRLSYILTSQPSLGTITNFTSSTGTLTYRALANATAGLDAVTFVANDGVLNSTIPGWIKINVLPLKRPPIVTNYTLNVTVGEVKWLPLKADAPDFPAADLKWYLTSNPKYGRAEIVDANRTLRYEAVNNGTDERFTFQVVDPEGYVGVGVIDGIVNPLLLVIPGGLPPPVVAGIVVGSVGAAALLGTAAAYFFYNRYMAAKFSAKWQEEWMKSNINENPLFVSNFKEQVNPLYNANT